MYLKQFSLENVHFSQFTFIVKNIKHNNFNRCSHKYQKSFKKNLLYTSFSFISGVYILHENNKFPPPPLPMTNKFSPVLKFFYPPKSKLTQFLG